MAHMMHGLRSYTQITSDRDFQIHCIDPKARFPLPVNTGRVDGRPVSTSRWPVLTGNGNETGLKVLSMVHKSTPSRTSEFGCLLGLTGLLSFSFLFSIILFCSVSVRVVD